MIYETQHKVQLIEKCCTTCGRMFAIDVFTDEAFRRNRQSFNCSNGHGNMYVESVEAQLERKLNILLHPRKSRTGSMFERHPTIQEAIALMNLEGIDGN